MAALGFRGGVHPAHRSKQLTSSSPVVRAPLPEKLVVPLSQHLGAPCLPLVEIGERVQRGQMIGDVKAMVSAPVHAAASGEVTDIRSVLLAPGTSSAAIEITTDPEQDYDSWVKVQPGEVRDVVCAAGIVGMGGAAFPTRVKLSPAHDTPIGTVILNGCECEPYLTCDHRLMLERPADVIAGGRIMRDTVGAKRLVVAVESDKADAAEALRSVAGDDVEVLVLPARYPQGAEKQLIQAVLGREVPHAKLPAVAGALVQNVGTAAAVSDAVERGKPLIERIVTVSGAVERPGNYLTLLGTPVAVLLETAGYRPEPGGRVIAGGPMTGFALASLEVPVVKGTSGVVALTAKQSAPAVHGEQPCIRCGRCAVACPMGLLPYSLGTFGELRKWDLAEKSHALDCIECGCCAFVCPTRRPLVQQIRRSKQVLMQKGAKL